MQKNRIQKEKEIQAKNYITIETVLIDKGTKKEEKKKGQCQS